MSDKCTIKFENVSFSYFDEHKVLSNTTFELKSGEITALVGPSGSGKTTIINLICALYSTSEGQIKIDDIPINELAISSLRRSIALVPQDSFIFEATVLDNIKYANRYASEEEVIKAAKMAHIHDEILSLPSGYNTILKKGNLNLSIGEQQRITIARAFLRKSSIMIFDEAFSNLDGEIEYRIIDSLRSLKDNKTIVIISHRLKNIVIVDNIIVVRKGRIVESGTPDKLMKAKSLFCTYLKSSSA